jgi:hypothetical protein
MGKGKTIKPLIRVLAIVAVVMGAGCDKGVTHYLGAGSPAGVYYPGEGGWEELPGGHMEEPYRLYVDPNNLYNVSNTRELLFHYVCYAYRKKEAHWYFEGSWEEDPDPTYYQQTHFPDEYEDEVGDDGVTEMLIWYIGQDPAGAGLVHKFHPGLRFQGHVAIEDLDEYLPMVYLWKRIIYEFDYAPEYPFSSVWVDYAQEAFDGHSHYDDEDIGKKSYYEFIQSETAPGGEVVDYSGDQSLADLVYKMDHQYATPFVENANYSNPSPRYVYMATIGRFTDQPSALGYTLGWDASGYRLPWKRGVFLCCDNMPDDGFDITAGWTLAHEVFHAITGYRHNQGSPHGTDPGGYPCLAKGEGEGGPGWTGLSVFCNKCIDRLQRYLDDDYENNQSWF